MFILTSALRGPLPRTCRGREQRWGKGVEMRAPLRSHRIDEPGHNKTPGGRSMRRPREGLVTQPPGGLVQPPAGITTGCRKAARDGDEGGGGELPLGLGAPRAVRPFAPSGSAVQGGLPERRTAKRREPPSSDRKGGRGRLASVPGRFRRPPREPSQAPASAGAPLPSRETRIAIPREGLPGADQRTRAMNCVSLAAGAARAPLPHSAPSQNAGPLPPCRRVFLTPHPRHAGELLRRRARSPRCASSARCGSTTSGKVLDAKALAEAANGCESSCRTGRRRARPSSSRSRRTAARSCASRSTSATSTSRPRAARACW